MRVGPMKHRIILEKFEEGVDDYGFPLDQWVEYKRLWADIVPVSGREYFASATVNYEVTSKIYIRYYDGIDPTMRVRYKNRAFDIQAVLIDYKKNMMTLLVKESP